MHPKIEDYDSVKLNYAGLPTASHTRHLLSGFFHD